MHMEQIWKLQWMQLRNHKLLYQVFLVFCLVSVLLSRFVFVPDLQDCRGSIVAVQSPMLTSQIVLFYLAISTPILVKKDYEDGTMYLMLTAGCIRSKLFLVKTIMAGFMNVIMGLVLFIIPVAYHTVLYGWGNAIALGGYILRLLLVAVIICRFTAQMILMSFLIKERYLAVGGGIARLAAELWLSSNYEIRNAAIPLFTAFNNIFDYTQESISHFNNTYIQFRITDQMDYNRQGCMLLFSFFVIVCCMIIGCSYFRLDDVH